MAVMAILNQLTHWMLYCPCKNKTWLASGKAPGAGPGLRCWQPRPPGAGGRYWDFLGPYLYFRVPIFCVLALSTREMSIRSACIQLDLYVLSNLLMKIILNGSVLRCWQLVILPLLTR